MFVPESTSKLQKFTRWVFYTSAHPSSCHICPLCAKGPCQAAQLPT